MSDLSPVSPGWLDEIDRLAGAATPGPWLVDPLREPDEVCGIVRPIEVRDGIVRMPYLADEIDKPADAAFIAAARTALPELSDALRRVLALADEYRTNCDPTSTQAQVAELFRAAIEGGDR